MIVTSIDNSLASPNFKRKPTPKEMVAYTSAINKGLKVLNKDLGIIIHNSCVPSTPHRNSGIGSLLSKASEKFFIPFLRSHCFKSIQQEPNYLRRVAEPSPYDPISTSKNIYMMPLERLASDEYDNILSREVLNNVILRKNKEKNPDRVNYDNVFNEYHNLLKSAYTSFLEKKSNNTLKTGLLSDFENFKIQKGEEIEPNALYEILTIKNQDENWKNWCEEDKYLYDLESNRSRLESLKREYADDIDFYMFKQWITEREIANTNKRNQELGIRIMADTPVAFTPTEVWLNKDLFFEDLAMGCPPDYFSKDGQRWGFPVLRHDKLFNKDGSLAKGGLFLQKRYEEIFKASPGGVRIDHVIGLIDPFVYTPSEATMNEGNSGRIYSSPYKEKFKGFTKANDKDFGVIFEKIIFPTAAKFGLNKGNIICEDLGELTPPVKRIMESLGLTGLSVIQYGCSGVDAPPKNVIMLGGHDNKSYIEYTDDFFQYKNDGFYYKTHILGSDTVIPGEDVNQYREDLRSDKKKFISASITEMFTSRAKKIQIFFTDFFGMAKTYNVPGSKKDCWTLRLPEDFERLYYSNLKRGYGVNLPEVIARAIRQKGESFSGKYQKLLKRLDKFANILKE